MSVIENRFLHEPDGWCDEEGDFAYVIVTEQTETADSARGWIVAHAEYVLGIDEEYTRVAPEYIEQRGLELRMLDWPGLLPTTWDVERLVREGLCEAWWRFDVSLAREEIPHPDDEAFERRYRERNAAEKLRAETCRGPWWWRLRCWLSQRALKAGNRLEPADITSAAWFDESDNWHYQVIRRPRA